MTQHLAFAGITLPLAPVELQSRLEEVNDLSAFMPTDLWQYADHDLVDVPTPSWPRPPKVKLGVLKWPTGAINAAWFFAAVTSDIADAIRAAVPDRQTPHTLVMDDGIDGNHIEAQMYLLPFLPLSQFGTTHPVYKDGWLLTLADQRFFWWYRYADITSHLTWPGIFAQIGTNLGVSIDLDPIDPGYTHHPPTEKWLKSNVPMSTYFDAAAAQVGQRVICTLDGIVKTVKWQTAKELSDAQLEDAHVIAGGFLEQPDLGKYLPSSVSVFFASGGGGCCAPSPYVVNRSLRSLPDVSGVLQSSGIQGATGNVYGDAIFDGTNSATLGSYAAVAASDWYGWRAADADVVFPGIQAWQPTGYEEYAEWMIQLRAESPYASTIVRRGEWDSLPSGSWEVGDCCEFFVQVTGGTDATGYSGTRVVQVGPNQWVPATAPQPLTFTNNIWRAPSNQVFPILPTIQPLQTVRVWRSPTYGPVAGVPQYECLPWGSQNKVTVLDPNCVSQDVWGRDLFSTPTVPPVPPPPPPIIADITGTTTTSPGIGVIKKGTATRFLTKNISGTGQGSGFTTVVFFGDGHQATGNDLTYNYTANGNFAPYALFFNSTGGVSQPTPILGGNGNGLFNVIADPGLAQTGTVAVTTAAFAKSDTTLTDIPGLTAVVSGATSYEYEAILPVLLDGSGGAQVAANVDVAPDYIIATGEIVGTSVTWVTGLSVNQSTVNGSPCIDGNATAGVAMLRVTGSFTTALNGAGNFTIRFAQHTAHLSSNVLRGATLTVESVQSNS